MSRGLQFLHIIPLGSSHALGCYSIIADLCIVQIEQMQANTFQRWKIIIFPGITTSVREAVYPGIRQADFDPSRLFIQRSPKTSDFAC